MTIPSLNPAIFLDAAEALPNKRDGLTYCCPQVGRSTHNVLGHYRDLERAAFQAWFQVGDTEETYTFEKLYLRDFGRKLSDSSPEMTRLRVMALCLAAAIAEDGGLG